MILQCQKCSVIDDSGSTPRESSAVCDPHDWAEIDTQTCRKIQLSDAFKAMRDAQNAAIELVDEAFPIGSEVFWAHGNRLRYATVIKHSGRLRINVRGTTGREYWMDIYSIISEMVEGSR